jgi:hypothetical protein
MEANVWTTIIIPLAVAVVSGTIQLLLEYTVIQPTLGNRVTHQATRQLSVDNQPEQTRLAKFEFLFLGFTRVLVIFVLAFGSVSVTASIGYELREVPGVIWGIVIGLTLTLAAMWAINKWSDVLAKAASALALVTLVTLVLAGLVTLAAKLAGLTVNFSEGLLIVAFGVLFIVGSLIALVVMIVLGSLGLLSSGSGSDFSSGNRTTVEGPSTVKQYSREGVRFVSRDEWTRK